MEREVAKFSLATVPAKKEDPGYAALRGHIPKTLYKRFKMFCLERGVDNSQGLEDLIGEYFEWKDKQEQEDSTPKTAESNRSKGSGTDESPAETSPSSATKTKRGQ